jgi:Domain of unknown function (DUF4372)
MIFSHVMDFTSHDVFRVGVKSDKGSYRAKDFTCWKQFLYLAFGQLTYRESMSDKMFCLELKADKLYHLGISKAVNKSTLSRANKKRD